MSHALRLHAAMATSPFEGHRHVSGPCGHCRRCLPLLPWALRSTKMVHEGRGMAPTLLKDALKGIARGGAERRVAEEPLRSSCWRACCAACHAGGRQGTPRPPLRAGAGPGCSCGGVGHGWLAGAPCGPSGSGAAPPSCPSEAPPPLACWRLSASLVLSRQPPASTRGCALRHGSLPPACLSGSLPPACLSGSTPPAHGTAAHGGCAGCLALL